MQGLNFDLGPLVQCCRTFLTPWATERIIISRWLHQETLKLRLGFIEHY